MESNRFNNAKPDGVSLTATDIHNKEFTSVGLFRGGYEQDEVNEFLDIITQDYIRFNSIIAKLTESRDSVPRSFVQRLEDLENEVAELKRRVR